MMLSNVARCETVKMHVFAKFFLVYDLDRSDLSLSLVAGQCATLPAALPV